jgi:hypothetical protein
VYCDHRRGRPRPDIAFHDAFVERLGSPRVLRMYDSITGEAHLCMVVKEGLTTWSDTDVLR